MKHFYFLLMIFSQIAIADDVVTETVSANEVGISFTVLKAEHPHETFLHEYIRNALSDETSEGAVGQIRGKTIVPINAKRAALQAMEKNLSLHISKYDNQTIEEALIEVRAVFDPILSASLTHNVSKKNNRSIIGSLNFRDMASIFPNGIENRLSVNTAPNQTQAQVIELGYRGQKGGIKGDQEIFASKADNFGSTITSKLTIGVSQQLEDGGSYTISEVTTNKPIFYAVDGKVFKTGAPWSSSLSVSLQMPLPVYGKGYGEFSSNNVSAMLAQKRKEKTHWVVKQLINQILLQVDLSYWELVNTYERLHVAIENRQRVGSQQERTKRLFKNGSVTRFNKVQVDAEFAKVRVQEEQAWRNLLLASQALSKLINNNTDDLANNIYAPVDYYGRLQDFLELNVEKMTQQGQTFRPDLFMAEKDLEMAKINQKFFQDQAKWDITVGGSWSASQQGSKYGYTEYYRSVGHLIDPDFFGQAYSIDVKRPLGNRAKETAKVRGMVSQESSAMDHNNKKVDITLEIRDAISIVSSARTRINLALDTEKLSQIAYDKLLRKRKVGADTTELELIVNLRNLLTAKLGVIQAYIANRKAESRLLLASGIIANRYMERTSTSSIDVNRMKVLAQNRKLSFFIPLK